MTAIRPYREKDLSELVTLFNEALQGRSASFRDVMKARGGQEPSGSGKLPFIPKGAGGNPHRGKGSSPWEVVQPPRIELIGLVHRAPHELGLGHMDEPGVYRPLSRSRP